MKYIRCDYNVTDYFYKDTKLTDANEYSTLHY